MKLFGSITELVSAVFRKNSQTITLRPNQATTYTAARDIQTPPQDADSVLVSQNATQTLTGKTLSGNTATNLVSGSGTFTFNTSGTVTAPNATDTLVGKATTDSLTNKTMGDALTFTQISTPSNPSSGFNKIYPKSDGLFYTLDSGGNEVAVGSGSGSGEINAVSNPSAASGTTGYTAGTSHTVAKDTSNSPLSPITSTSLAISSSAAVSDSSTAGVYNTISTLAAGLLNKKLKVEFYMTTPASSGGTWGLSVYVGSTRLSLSTDSSGETILPSGVTGKYTAYFDSTSTASNYTVHFYQKARTGSNTLYVTNVVVGPGIQPQGSVVGDWVSFTPTGTFSGANVTYTGRYRREGDTMTCKVQVRMTGAPTDAGTSLFNLPSGFTIDTSKLPGTLTGNESILMGNGTAYDIGTASYPVSVVYSSTTTVLLRTMKADGTYVSAGSGTGVSATVPFTFGNTDTIEFNFQAPIAEWAGSGTVNLAQNDVEYAYNTVSANTNSNDTTSFGYGPAGANFPSAALTNNYTRRVRFQTPIQASQTVWLQVDPYGDGHWINLPSGDWKANGIQTVSQLSDANNFGIGIHNPVTGSNTDVDVIMSINAASAIAWNANTAVAKWRVAKAATGQAVGFGLVSSTSSGLIPATLSNLDDVAATRMGLKVYAHGGSYNGGLAPTITLAAGGGSLTTVVRSLFLPYQIQDGSWRMKFNIAVTLSSASRTVATLAVAGVTFKNGNQQAISAVNTSTIPAAGASYTASNSGNMSCEHASGTTSGYFWSGDVELDSKPTWAY